MFQNGWNLSLFCCVVSKEISMRIEHRCKKFSVDESCCSSKLLCLEHTLRAVHNKPVHAVSESFMFWIVVVPADCSWDLNCHWKTVVFGGHIWRLSFRFQAVEIMATHEARLKMLVVLRAWVAPMEIVFLWFVALTIFYVGRVVKLCNSSISQTDNKNDC